MSEKINDGGPAFPGERKYFAIGLNAEHGEKFPGMSFRAYAAVAAMQGLLASDASYGGSTEYHVALARDAIQHADALIAELAKGAGE